MKKLNITKKQFTESKYFQKKYGKLEYVSESGKLFKTNKGKVLKFKESIDEQKSEWFHKIGGNSYELTKPIPGYCVVDCSGPGSKDDEVSRWVDELKFDIGLPRDAAIEHLEQYGAWDKEELESKTDNELAQILLWLFCGDIYEQAHEMAEDEPDVEALGDPSDWDDDIWEKFQREYACGCYLNG